MDFARANTYIHVYMGEPTPLHYTGTVPSLPGLALITIDDDLNRLRDLGFQKIFLKSTIRGPNYWAEMHGRKEEREREGGKKSLGIIRKWLKARKRIRWERRGFVQLYGHPSKIEV